MEEVGRVERRSEVRSRELGWRKVGKAGKGSTVLFNRSVSGVNWAYCIMSGPSTRYLVQLRLCT